MSVLVGSNSKRMDFVNKVLLFCVVLHATLCSAEGENDTACLVSYLKGKGKLNETFQSSVSSSSQCESEVQLTIQIIKSTFKDRIQRKFPNKANCLINAFNQAGVIDNILKISVLKNSSMLNDSDKDVQLDDTRKEFKDGLNKIAVQCAADDKNFKTIFNTAMGIKNETWVAYQRIYCLAKYVGDHKLLDLHDVDINPLLIDPEGVDCDYIIEVERTESDKALKEKFQSDNSIYAPCILRMYAVDYGKGSYWFGRYVSEKVLRFLKMPEQVKQREIDRINDKFGRFWYASVSASCLSNK